MVGPLTTSSLILTLNSFIIFIILLIDIFEIKVSIYHVGYILNKTCQNKLRSSSKTWRN